MNYQKELEKVIEKNMLNDTLPKLLLHSCCAPCSSYVLEYLQPYFDIAIFFYNPNIWPELEYKKRLYYQKRFLKDGGFDITLVEGGYERDTFMALATGNEKEKEGGKRCFSCYNLRLEETVKYATLGKYDYFGTTLTISPMKNAKKLNEIGFQLEEKYGVMWLPSDFKKNDGYKRSMDLSKKYNLYRQSYCGCEFSRKEEQYNE